MKRGKITKVMTCFFSGILFCGSSFLNTNNLVDFNGNLTDVVYADDTTVDMSKLLDMDELYGWADVEGEGLESTTGGGNMTPVVVSTFEEFSSLVSGDFPRVIVVDGTIDTVDKSISIGSNKTIVGIDSNAYINGGVNVYNASNVIISNLNFNGGWPIVGPNDCIDVSNSHHVWFNHLNIYNAYDGNLDIKMGSDYITVSWCKFSYTDDTTDTIAPDHDHRRSCLIGSGGGDHDDTDMGKLRVSYHHNWFGDNIDDRMPRVMYGRAHVYNNYYTSENNSYCIGVDSYAQTLIENNYFKNVNNPHRFMYFQSSIPASITARGNEYDNSNGDMANGQKWDDNHVVEFNNTVYDYMLNEAKDIPEIVTSYAGPKDDISDTSQFVDRTDNATLVKGVNSSYKPPQDLEPIDDLKQTNFINNNPVTYDSETDTYTYHGQNTDESNAFYNIDNPFKGKDFSEFVYDYLINERWEKGVTVSYWINVPDTAVDAAVLSFNLENDRQMERKDAVKYALCKDYEEENFSYSLGESKTYVDAAGKEYTVLIEEPGYLAQYNPNYPDKGCYKINDSGGAICAYEKGTDSTDESNWKYLEYVGKGFYDNYSVRFDEEGGEKSLISEAKISGSLCIYASGSIGFRQDNGNGIQMNPNLETYGNNIDIQQTNQFYYWGNGGYISQAGSSFITPTMSGKNKWHFVVVNIQNDWVQFYMDGKEMTTLYLNSWGAKLIDKQGVAGETFNYGFGYRYRQTYYSEENFLLSCTSKRLMDFITDEKTVLTVGGGGAASRILGQDDIGTPDGTRIKDLTFYDDVRVVDVPADRPVDDNLPDDNNPPDDIKPSDNKLPGDVDNNKKIDLNDAKIALKLAVGIITDYTNLNYNNADYNNDKKVDLNDAKAILRIAVGIV